jgi:hypothetical protein
MSGTRFAGSEKVAFAPPAAFARGIAELEIARQLAPRSVPRSPTSSFKSPRPYTHPVRRGYGRGVMKSLPVFRRTPRQAINRRFINSRPIGECQVFNSSRVPVAFAQWLLENTAKQNTPPGEFAPGGMWRYTPASEITSMGWRNVEPSIGRSLSPADN